MWIITIVVGDILPTVNNDRLLIFVGTPTNGDTPITNNNQQFTNQQRTMMQEIVE